jgi:DNA-binding SARP family transcriptional activator/tetratricopeptide (TPR) repeat protein
VDHTFDHRATFVVVVNEESTDPSAPPIRFAVLGPVRAWSGDHELNLGPRQQRQILGLLLTRIGRDVQVHQIIEMLWGHAAPASAVNSVHRFIGALRRTLEPGLAARSGGRWLLRRDSAYRLVAPLRAIDLMEFRRLVDEARQAENFGFRDVAIARYAEALAQSHGRCADDGTQEVRRYSAFVSIDEEYASAARDAARAAVAFGQIGTLLPAVRRAAELSPLDEALQARLMLMLAADGRQADAFALFQSVRDTLDRELGVDPGPELRAAYDDVLHPRHKAPAAAGPAPAAQIIPAQLPRDLPLFTGRRAELDRATGLVADGEAMPVIAVDGMPGVGKSVFAVHWAHEVAGRFPDGQIYLDLRGPDGETPPMSAGEALESLLSTLGINSAAIPPGLGAKAALYRSHIAGRRILVLLDNAANVEQVRPLLPGAAECLVVITSRMRLTGLSASNGAELLTLGLPGEDDARTLLTRRLTATTGRQSWTADRDALDSIIKSSGRLPLALTAVSAEVAVYPTPNVADVAAELRRRGAEPDAFGTDGASMLRNAFACAYRSLSRPGARLFRLLSLHPGPDFSAAAAAAMTGLAPEDVRPLLVELTRSHLLTASPGGRLAWHPLLRAYARELCESTDDRADRCAAGIRLVQHYRHTAYAAHLLMRPLLAPIPPGEVPEGVTVEPIDGYRGAIAWFQAEQEVLRRIVDWPAASEAGPAKWQLATTLLPFFQRTGLVREWLATMSSALNAVEVTGDRQGQAHLLRCLAGACHFLGDDGQARDHLRRAQQIFAALGLTTEQAYVHNNMGVVLAAIGSHAEAENEFEKARVLYQQAGHRKGVASALEGVAACQASAGKQQSAVDHYERAMAGYQRLGDQNGMGGCLLGLGGLWLKAGKANLALDYLRRAVDAYREVGNRADEAHALIALGDALAAVEQDAVPAWREALEILDKLRLPAAITVLDRLRP